MAGRWSLHLFNWDRYSNLAPALSAAYASGGFDDLDDDEAWSVIDALDADAGHAEICNSLLLELCVAAESATFDSRLPSIVLWLRKQPDAEDAAEMIASLMSRNQNVEDWYECESGLVGLLKSDEVIELDSALTRFRTRFKPNKRVGGLSALTKLFSTAEAQSESIEDLLSIVAEARERQAGLAAVLDD